MSAIEQFQGQSLIQQAEMLSKSGMVPKAFRGKPADVLVASLWGAELGLGPISSMQFIDVIEGSPTLNTEGRMALVRRAGHSVALDVNDDRAIAKGKRRDSGDEHVVEFSMKDAAAAGLANKQVWKQYRKSMLGNRAMSQLCRVLFSDVTMGLSYAPEEVASFSAPELLDSQPEALVRGVVGSSGNAEPGRSATSATATPQLPAAPVEVVSASPRTFPAPTMRSVAQANTDKSLADATAATPAEPEADGVPAEQMAVLRATLDKVTHKDVRSGLVKRWSDAGLPNVKAASVTLTTEQFDAAMKLALDAEEAQVEWEALEAPFTDDEAMLQGTIGGGGVQ